MSKATEIVKESYTRSMGKDIIGRFYDIFLANPEIAPMFAKTDLTMQKKLLKHGVHLAIMMAEGNSLGENGVSRIRESHSIEKMSISPNLYPIWKQSFLEAVSETDPEFAPEVREAWDSVLQEAIAFISNGYKS